MLTVQGCRIGGKARKSGCLWRLPVRWRRAAGSKTARPAGRIQTGSAFGFNCFRPRFGGTRAAGWNCLDRESEAESGRCGVYWCFAAKRKGLPAWAKAVFSDTENAQGAMPEGTPPWALCSRKTVRLCGADRVRHPRRSDERLRPGDRIISRSWRAPQRLRLLRWSGCQAKAGARRGSGFPRRWHGYLRRAPGRPGR